MLQKPGPSFPNPALAFLALPMHQPPPERDYGFSRQKISGEALSELGARPKLLPASIAPALQLAEDDDIYHSDEDISFEELDRNISVLVGPASPGSEFRTYLLHGNKTEGLEYAMRVGLWGHALFMASKMDGQPAMLCIPPPTGSATRSTSTHLSFPALSSLAFALLSSSSAPPQSQFLASALRWRETAENTSGTGRAMGGTDSSGRGRGTASISSGVAFIADCGNYWGRPLALSLSPPNLAPANSAGLDSGGLSLASPAVNEAGASGVEASLFFALGSGTLKAVSTTPGLINHK